MSVSRVAAGLALILAVGLTTGHATASAPASLASATVGAPGIGDPYFPHDGNGGYDVRHYGVRVTMDLAHGRLTGHTTITAVATQSLSRFNLDLLLNVDAVEVDGEPAGFEKPGAHELQVTPTEPLAAGQTFHVAVTYRGHPKQISYGGERSWFGDPAEVVAMNEPHIAPWWFPANDHPSDKARFDITVRVPRGKQVVANGRLVHRTASAHWTTWHWHASDPMATYLAFFVAGSFRLERGTSAGLPYVLAVSRSLGVEAQRPSMALLRRTPVVLAWLEERLGPYPFDTTGGVVTAHRTNFALETQTRPTYPYVGGADSDWIVAHELAHQWVGDSVSIADWRDIWLNEGLATYLEALWTVHRWGGTPTRWLRETYGSYTTGPAGCDTDFWKLAMTDPGPGDLFDEAIYERGAMAIGALRRVVGTDTFWTIVRQWVADHANGNAATPDFEALAESVSGLDLDAFFTAWLVDETCPADTSANGLGFS